MAVSIGHHNHHIQASQYDKYCNSEYRFLGELSGRAPDLQQEQQDFFSPGSTFCADLFWNPFLPHITTEACEKY